MKLGIKVGPDNVADSLHNLETLRPKAAEVWFNIARQSEYDELFSTMKRLGTEVGLHYWGALPDGVWTNIAYPDTELIAASVALMKKTIDIAAQNGHSYVNIHPGAAAKVAIDFSRESFKLLSEPVEQSVAANTFLEQFGILHEYANKRNIVLTVETVPQRVAQGWYDPKARLTPITIHELPIQVLEQAAVLGYWIANDFSHTVGNIMTESPQTAWEFLREKTILLAAQTRLIHLGFSMPPFNGTDVHDMLDNPILDTINAVPNKMQMKELFQLFTNRPDVWVITEPKADHLKNYHLAKQIIDSASSSN